MKLDLPNWIKERSSYYSLRLKGYEVSRCCFGRPGLELHLSGVLQVVVSPAQLFTLTRANETSTFKEWDVNCVGPLVELVGVEVSEAIVEKYGGLKIVLANGVVFSIAPAEYEAWELKANDGTHILSVCEGRVAFWTP